jgi:hypothetical protein
MAPLVRYPSLRNRGGTPLWRIFFPPPLEKEQSLSTRVVVVVAAAVAVAMLPMAGLAWAQEQTSTIAPTDRDDTSTIAPTDRDDPRIKPISPNPGSHTRDRTPTIKAKVTDNDHDLDKRDIKLNLDRDRIRNFDYSRRRNVLEYTPNKRLSLGKHTVKVVAEAARGEKATEKWSFRVVR